MIVGDITGDGGRVRTELGGCGRQHVGAAAGDHHLAAGADDGAGAGQADTRAAAGDESNFPSEL